MCFNEKEKQTPKQCHQEMPSTLGKLLNIGLGKKYTD
jgi:hypothetical protein